MRIQQRETKRGAPSPISAANSMPRTRAGREGEGWRSRLCGARWSRFVDALQSNQNFEYLYWLQVRFLTPCALSGALVSFRDKFWAWPSHALDVLVL